MKEKALRTPTGPAVIFLINAITFFFSLLSSMLYTQILDGAQELTPLGILRLVFWGAINLFMSIILFTKKYNNTLIIGASVLLIPNLITLFSNITPDLIGEIFFSLVLIAFIFIMVNMPDTPIREKAVKARYVIPVFKFILILISTIELIQGVYEKHIEYTGMYPDENMSIALTLLPSVLSAITGFLPVLCYAWLVNWLADPYEKQK